MIASNNSNEVQYLKSGVLPVIKFYYTDAHNAISTLCSPSCKAYITIAIRLRYDYDTTTTKKWHVQCSFFAGVESRRMEAARRARYVVVGS